MINHEVCHDVLDHLKIFVHQLDNFDQNLNQSFSLFIKLDKTILKFNKTISKTLQASFRLELEILGSGDCKKLDQFLSLIQFILNSLYQIIELVSTGQKNFRKNTMVLYSKFVHPKSEPNISKFELL
ncbi:hypothetical protein BpHYR1_054418 [Brachionus plicatilis]|uniref:Uncharacterized protein n=1 Tax=Brachionus plicatilis TaxID=10195 RepID=A0A3M7PWS3_BRAPC|nr:hypothetical protein BpHYR1_054418 [Brachionus plicatilis]